MEEKNLESVLIKWDGDLQTTITSLYHLQTEFVRLYLDSGVFENMQSYKDELFHLNLIINYLEERAKV